MFSITTEKKEKFSLHLDNVPFLRGSGGRSEWQCTKVEEESVLERKNITRVFAHHPSPLHISR
jgi:hypothetical protein